MKVGHSAESISVAAILWRHIVLGMLGYVHGLVYCGEILWVAAILGLPSCFPTDSAIAPLCGSPFCSWRSCLQSGKPVTYLSIRALNR